MEDAERRKRALRRYVRCLDKLQEANETYFKAWMAAYNAVPQRNFTTGKEIPK